MSRDTRTLEVVICDECESMMLSESPITCQEPGCPKEMHSGCAFWVSVQSHHKKARKPGGDPMHLVKTYCHDHAQPFIKLLEGAEA